MQTAERFVLMAFLRRPVETRHEREKRLYCYYDPQTQSSVCNHHRDFPHWVTLRKIIREELTFPAVNAVILPTKLAHSIGQRISCTL